MSLPQLNIVISMYNEAEGICPFAQHLVEAVTALPVECCHIVWVDDGSQDDTVALLRPLLRSSKGVQHSLIRFSKNFGHEAAMLAGLDVSTEGAVLCMDSDGQHPPEVISDLWEQYLEGGEVVLAHRLSRADASVTGNLMSQLFYRMMNGLSDVRFQANASDFFLIDQKVAEVLRQEYRERNRFLRGFIQSVGFEQRVVEYDSPERALGQSKYSFKSLLKLSANALFVFSSRPLRITIFFSSMFVLFTLLFASYSLWVFWFHERPPSGYTSIVLLNSVAFSMLFVAISVLAVYFEKALSEIRGRPIYLVRSQEHFDTEDQG
jgi:dolichol-phosphate mannosyltransferase